MLCWWHPLFLAIFNTLRPITLYCPFAYLSLFPYPKLCSAYPLDIPFSFTLTPAYTQRTLSFWRFAHSPFLFYFIYIYAGAYAFIYAFVTLFRRLWELALFLFIYAGAKAFLEARSLLYIFNYYFIYIK